MFLLCFQVAELDFWKDTQKESDWKKRNVQIWRINFSVLVLLCGSMMFHRFRLRNPDCRVSPGPPCRAQPRCEELRKGAVPRNCPVQIMRVSDWKLNQISRYGMEWNGMEWNDMEWHGITSSRGLGLMTVQSCSILQTTEAEKTVSQQHCPVEIGNCTRQRDCGRVVLGSSSETLSLATLEQGDVFLFIHIVEAT